MSQGVLADSSWNFVESDFALKNIVARMQNFGSGDGQEEGKKMPDSVTLLVSPSKSNRNGNRREWLQVRSTSVSCEDLREFPAFSFRPQVDPSLTVPARPKSMNNLEKLCIEHENLRQFSQSIQQTENDQDEQPSSKPSQPLGNIPLVKSTPEIKNLDTSEKCPSPDKPISVQNSPAAKPSSKQPVFKFWNSFRKQTAH